MSLVDTGEPTGARQTGAKVSSSSGRYVQAPCSL